MGRFKNCGDVKEGNSTRSARGAQAKGRGVKGNIFEFKIVADENPHASRSRFNGSFNFLCDEEYREVYEAKRNFDTLGAEKLKIT